MALEPTLIGITAKLRQGKFPNEQSISQGIVLRDGRARSPGAPSRSERIFFTTEAQRAQRALHPSALIPHPFPKERPPTKPAEFIEVKPPGKAEDSVRQALGPSSSETSRRRRARRANEVRPYAFHTGVPFIVLTDGRTWSFHLPAEQGSYEDRGL